MGDATTERFFADLPPLVRFADALRVESYQAAPRDWDVIVTDVMGSTKAIGEGRYKDVNALGVASIVALRNALRDVDLPFVFGGDGATALCPASRRERVERTLRGVRKMASEAFELALRVAIVPIGELVDAGHPVLVARLRTSEHVAWAKKQNRG